MSHERARADGIPVFSPRLDEVMASMLKGEAPNVGRFCAHCYTPLTKSAQTCPHCGFETAARPPLPKLPPEIFALYRRMRRRESLIVNSFAFAGLGIGLVLFVVLVALAVYRFEQSWAMLAVALAVLLVGGRVFAGILGGWIGDQIGYDFARKRLVAEWEEFERQRDVRRDAIPKPTVAAADEPTGTR